METCVLKYHPKYSDIIFNRELSHNVSELCEENMNILVHGTSKSGKRTLVNKALDLYKNLKYNDISHETTIGYVMRSISMTCIDFDALSNKHHKILKDEYTYLRNCMNMGQKKILILFSVNEYNEKIQNLLIEILNDGIVQLIVTSSNTSGIVEKIKSNFVQIRVPYPTLDEYNNFLENIGLSMKITERTSIIDFLIQIDCHVNMYQREDHSYNILSKHMSYDEIRNMIDKLIKYNTMNKIYKLILRRITSFETIQLLADCQHRHIKGSRANYHLEFLLFKLNHLYFNERSG